jgi:hypothetical protein
MVKSSQHHEYCPKCDTTYWSNLKYRTGKEGCPFCHSRIKVRKYNRSKDIPKSTRNSSKAFKSLSMLQQRIIKYQIAGLTYKEIAFRISGNRKGSYSCDNVSYQIRLAKRKLLQF